MEVSSEMKSRRITENELILEQRDMPLGGGPTANRRSLEEQERGRPKWVKDTIMKVTEATVCYVASPMPRGRTRL